MGLFNLGSLDLSGALGSAPAGLYSGLDPSASMGAWGNSPLGGGLSGQVAGASPISSPAAGGMNPLAMMAIQQALSASFGHQQSPQQIPYGDYAQPQAILAPGQAMPAMNAHIGRMLMGGA